MSPPAAIRQFKDYLLQPELEDARRRLADPGYWGDSGRWVLLAVQAVETAVDGVPCAPDARVADWLAAVVAGIESARDGFCAEEADPDGYGSATFAACLRRARALPPEDGR
ncbi:MAG: hypothetical protein HGA75_10035 [Thiobacillus sp.]|nr:hypothetical protein [Thiobacillus sp.]